MLIFEQAISLSRSGKQTADNFVHRATRSKMSVFKTTSLHWGYGLGRFFGSEWGLLTFEHTPGVVNFNAVRRCTPSFGHCFGDRADKGCPVKVDAPAENTVAVCDTISRITKM